MRCSSLDGDGRQCRNKAAHGYGYHGDPELYSGNEGLTWVKVYLCKKHGNPLPNDFLKAIPESKERDR